MKEITLHQFLSHFTMDTRDDKRYCFILGAGASKPSGIRTGGELVKVWMDELNEIYKDDKNKLDFWKAEKKIADDDLASHYSNIFEKRYELDKEDGYAFLEQEMDGKEPSCGYSVLAQIVSQTPHNIIITTNFDSLSEDALFIYTQKKPLVIGHSSLAGYIKPGGKRPVIVKIHNDIFLSPQNTTKETSTLHDGFKDNLIEIFKYYIPIVIGYGGNDDSLMGFLNDLATNKNIKQGMFWFHREDGNNPKEEIINLIKKFKGCLVKMDGFDEMMIGLGDKLKLDRLDGEITKIAEKRAKNYREQIEKVMGKDSTPKETKDAINDMATRKEKDWWSYELLARGENDLMKRNNIYLEGLKFFKESPELLGNYANFLHFTIKDTDYNKIEKYYKKTIELEPGNANILGNYAIFFTQIRKNHDKAEEYYKKAIELDPTGANNIGNYANFLHHIRKDYNNAEKHYKKAIELDPTGANHIGNYAKLLIEQGNSKNAEIHIAKAFEYNQKDENKPLALELWFYRYAIFYKEFPESADKIDDLLAKGVQSIGWNLDAILEIAKKNNHPEYDKLSEFARRITTQQN